MLEERDSKPFSPRTLPSLFPNLFSRHASTDASSPPESEPTQIKSYVPSSGEPRAAMAPGTANLVLKAACEACGKAADLYGTACRHATVCSSCGKTMARARAPCAVCAAPITNLIREYNVRVDTTAEKALSIGKFTTGLPPFSKKKIAGNHWSLRKDGPEGRQLTASMREKYNNRKPWILEDETGEHQYQSQLEASQSATATYYLLMMHGREFHAVPVGSWYNFSKIAQYKQLTLEEAEEKMKRRRSNATGYERWMMKSATHGAAAFGSDLKDLDGVNGKAAGGVQPKKEDTNKEGTDKGEEEEELRAPRKNAHGLTTKGVDDEEEGGIEDFDLDFDIEIGDDWEHEEAFSDDDETPYVDPEERPDLADTENPAPPEIKQDDDEDEQGAGGLSKSGKELKKLLRRADGQSESDDDDHEDTDEDESPSPVLAPKLKDEFERKPESNPAKLTASGPGICTLPASRSNHKRKSGGDDAKTSNGPVLKKPKKEPETKTLGVKEERPSSMEPKTLAVKEEPTSSLKPVSKAFASVGSDRNTSSVTEEEIRRVLIAVGPMTSQDFASRFKSRLTTPEDKKHFLDIMKKISYADKTKGGCYIYLRKEYK
uniref:Uncharacterized protein n=1 Tax=Avena sativa TaxID=4498 RepID=A0ACD5X4F8_AVESA